ncbi:MAG: D-tyrosyl-tRNA(Tyr) deacylase [Chloroflexi bacterium]|nr:D-tyrosyl-tRNA(Tyr) deacylase [Chloroflexota bacterium]MCI0775323.1 D-tyrosyl-tRNA(Tyr) deacylase [Chloroflexota bacterium]MCI0803213.1 D-tyrosyl-tRNA(Tyr) deacylase [Chloroflexota bacterium]MCI0807582.1 D-tyrosyl-tRNA(Tyr) deacylase [Chloroflexota bacterium]MCI0833156.1 D-tyrosyl-tRNA(Tyr) deacylase [Chloroflexota bacterium]
MRAVIQRVNRASVSVDGNVIGEIGPGLCLLIGITHEDSDNDLKYIVEKTLNMRIFPPEAPEPGDSGFDRSVQDIGGGLLLVSQFTLYASTRKGRRPGFTDAARPEMAGPMFDRVVAAFRSSGLRVETGVFGALMNVAIENAGPVTIVLDSADRNTPRRG